MATRQIDRPIQNVATRHEGFLRHGGFLWLKIALAVSAVALAAYAMIDVHPRPNGGSWYGYTLGTIGALLILWLSLLGVRKRAMTRGRWSLKAWTSAHVYLGGALVVIATLHCGFQFGWNVHTLAYLLMLVVIASGVFGVVVYARLPTVLSTNRAEMTQGQMVENLRQIDRQLEEAAQPLIHAKATIVRLSLDQDPFAAGAIRRLSGRYPRCGTREALSRIREMTGAQVSDVADPMERIERLLERKTKALEQIRRHMRLKAVLEVWLYVHVPMTFALLAALTAHIVSVFFYW
jgi:hypothetical protein